MATMEMAYGLQGSAATKAACGYLAQPFCSFAIAARILAGCENHRIWPIRERAGEDLLSLRRSGRSYIVATGHFRRESTLMIYREDICPGRIVNVSAALLPPSARPRHLRQRLQLRQMLDTLKFSRQDITIAWVGAPARRLLRDLERPGCQLVVAADAVWQSSGCSGFRRAFAGMRSQKFSLGPAALSRLAQVPIVPVATFIDEDGTIGVEWGSVIPPPKRHDAKADLNTSNQILDYLENAIGRRPCQYVLYIGEERRWDPESEVWTLRPDADQGLAPAEDRESRDGAQAESERLLSA